MIFVTAQCGVNHWINVIGFVHVECDDKRKLSNQPKNAFMSS